METKTILSSILFLALGVGGGMTLSKSLSATPSTDPSSDTAKIEFVNNLNRRLAEAKTAINNPTRGSMRLLTQQEKGQYLSAYTAKPCDTTVAVYYRLDDFLATLSQATKINDIQNIPNPENLGFYTVFGKNSSGRLTNMITFTNQENPTHANIIDNTVYLNFGRLCPTYCPPTW